MFNSSWIPVIALIGSAGFLAGRLIDEVVYRVPRGLAVTGPVVVGASPRPPIPPSGVATAITWVALTGWTVSGFASVAMLPTLLVVSAACVALWQIDIEHHRLPNAIVYPLYPVVAVGLLSSGLVTGSWPVSDIAMSIGIWLGTFSGILLLTRGRGIGMGDVKFAPVLAAVVGAYGVSSSVVALFSAFVLGGITGIVLLIRGRSRHSALPFGPFMIAGAAVGLALGAFATTW